jgi:methylmalonyl-CoA/ethylmalonyl-CoA epimerase
MHTAAHSISAMQIDHLGIAVRSVEAAADRLSVLLGYERRTSKVHNTRQRVNVLFLRKPGSLDLKLIEPADDQSPLVDFVRKGGGLHHLCFKVPNVAQACTTLSALGARVLAAPAPGEAFDDQPIAFLYVGHGLNVEVIDTDLRRGLLEEISR